MKSTRLHITRAALVQRLTRRLRRDGEHLRKSRGQGMQIEVGDFYTVMDGCIFRTHIHLEELARKLGVLEAWEQLQGAEQSGTA
jgi:hypothetical protein